MVGSCEHGNKPSRSLKGAEFLDQLNALLASPEGLWVRFFLYVRWMTLDAHVRRSYKLHTSPNWDAVQLHRRQELQIPTEEGPGWAPELLPKVAMKKNVIYIRWRVTFCSYAMFYIWTSMIWNYGTKWCQQQATGVKTKYILTDDLTNLQCKKRTTLTYYACLALDLLSIDWDA